METETMTIEEFEAIPRNTRPPTPQRLAILAMQVGEALILNHDGVVHGSANGHCGLTKIVSYATKMSRNYRYKSRHLPDGGVAVACYAKEQS